MFRLSMNNIMNQIILCNCRFQTTSVKNIVCLHKNNNNQDINHQDNCQNITFTEILDDSNNEYFDESINACDECINIYDEENYLDKMSINHSKSKFRS